MNGKPKLRLDWATFKSADYACKNWHYSGCMSVGKSVKIGAWEEDRFIGCVVYGLGAGNSTNGSKYGLKKSGEIAELVRMAFRDHVTPASRIMSIAQRMLVKANPKLRLLISFSDTEQGHHGGIYQANGWLYSGVIESTFHKFFMINGVKFHGRSLGARYGIGGQSLKWLQAHVDPNARYAKEHAKHRYLMPLDKEMRETIEPLRKPYPKREKQAMVGPPTQRRGSADLHAPKSKSYDVAIQSLRERREQEQKEDA